MFSKYSGAGNTFLLFDGRKDVFPSQETSAFCRSEQVDGVVVLEDSHLGDFKMRIFNADGSEASMCGNGIRCLTRFLKELGVPGEAFSIETGASEKMGCLTVRLAGDEVEVEMGNPHGFEFQKSCDQYLGHFINTGVPHYVLFEEPKNIQEEGRFLRFHQDFAPHGTNVNFVQVLGSNSIKVRTYERGVEGETLACGTGSVASAIVSSIVHGLTSPIQVHVQSGASLKIKFTPDHREVTMTGPAIKIPLSQ